LKLLAIHFSGWLLLPALGVCALAYCQRWPLPFSEVFMNILIYALLLSWVLFVSVAAAAHAPAQSHLYDEAHEDHAEAETQVLISAAIASASGVTTAVAGAGVINERLKLYGNIVADPVRVSHIQARYPGLVRGVKVTIGSRVRAGDTLAMVESNDSLREYPLLAPIDGIVIERHANPGEFTGEQVLFTLMDDRVLELHLPLFPADAHRVKTGQRISLEVPGAKPVTTKIEYITPRIGVSPSLEIHASLDNSQGLWVPNQLVEAWVDIAQTPVKLMVDNRGLQQVDGHTGVFVQDRAQPQRYRFHPLRLGLGDGQFTQVVEGLRPGDSYVLGSAYLLKAELEKSGAAHEH
jgi:cobalt-zinc-cadmium efflux system membrane fusion protein